MLGVMHRDKLNITAKALLNLENNPDKCISLTECNLDCLDRLGDIHEGGQYTGLGPTGIMKNPVTLSSEGRNLVI